jgi:hypothetical protein
MMVNTRRLGANISFLFNFFAVSLLQLPRKVMTPPMKLKILIPLKPLVADLTHKSIGGQ